MFLTTRRSTSPHQTPFCMPQGQYVPESSFPGLPLSPHLRVSASLPFSLSLALPSPCLPSPCLLISFSPCLLVCPSPRLYSNTQSLACRDATHLTDLSQIHGPHRPDLGAVLGSGQLWA